MIKTKLMPQRITDDNSNENQLYQHVLGGNWDNFKAARELLQKGTNPNVFKNETHITALFEAIEKYGPNTFEDLKTSYRDLGTGKQWATLLIEHGATFNRSILTKLDMQAATYLNFKHLVWLPHKDFTEYMEIFVKAMGTCYRDDFDKYPYILKSIAYSATYIDIICRVNWERTTPQEREAILFKGVKK